ncbi:hypothetical protein SCOR_22675 [Sulfidibacter corallicola]
MERGSPSGAEAKVLGVSRRRSFQLIKKRPLDGSNPVGGAAAQPKPRHRVPIRVRASRTRDIVPQLISRFGAWYGQQSICLAPA